MEVLENAIRDNYLNKMVENKDEIIKMKDEEIKRLIFENESLKKERTQLMSTLERELSKPLFKKLFG